MLVSPLFLSESLLPGWVSSGQGASGMVVHSLDAPHVAPGYLSVCLCHHMVSNFHFRRAEILGSVPEGIHLLGYSDCFLESVGKALLPDLLEHTPILSCFTLSYSSRSSVCVK